jgi:hypothetical protein
MKSEKSTITTFYLNPIPVKGSLRGASPLFLKVSPPLLRKERGIKGERLSKQTYKGKYG